MALVAVLVGASGVAYWRLSDGTPMRDGAPSWSADGRRIVFAAEAGADPADIYVMNADGSHRRRLTDHRANDTNPAFSPDDRQIAFESSRDGSTEIYVMDADGGDVRRLTHNPARDGSPAWSPDGTRIAFMSDRTARANADIYTMRASDGSDVRRLTHDLANWAPQYSPDGRSIAVQVDRDIVVIDAASGAARRLTREPDNGMNPTWAPDGSRMAFVSSRNGRVEIFSMNADGSDQRVMLSMPGGSAIDPRWSAVGDRIAFVFVPGPNPDGPGEPSPSQAIYTLDIASGRADRISR